MNKPLTLEKVVSQYIEEKRSLGFKYDKNEQILNRFIRLAEQEGYTKPQLDEALVKIWISKTAYETEKNRQYRIGVIRGLADYMIRLGYQAYVYSVKPRIFQNDIYEPHIFTNDELAELFQSAAKMSDIEKYPFRSMQYTLILKMLYSTGMRSSELMQLKKNDVDLDTGILHIRETKFKKERFIPLNETILQQSQNYDRYIRSYEQWQQSEHFFFNSQGTSLKDIYHPYRLILKTAGISHGGRGKGPRVHDLRHTFAVHCLRNWVRNGKDLTTALPYLSAYMGHSGIRSSQYYLRLTAELYPDIVNTLDVDYGWVIPEVDIDEDN